MSVEKGTHGAPKPITAKKGVFNFKVRSDSQL